MEKILYQGDADIWLTFVYGSMELLNVNVVVEEGIPGLYAKLVTSAIIPFGALDLAIKARDGRYFSGLITYQEPKLIKFSIINYSGKKRGWSIPLA